MLYEGLVCKNNIIFCVTSYFTKKPSSHSENPATTTDRKVKLRNDKQNMKMHEMENIKNIRKGERPANKADMYMSIVYD